jgi:hypothetical protein
MSRARNAAAKLLMFSLWAASLASSRSFGQAADVPYVPTPMVVVDAMLNIAGVGAQDFVIDLGSGDGRIVIAAAKKYGARGFGVDWTVRWYPTRAVKLHVRA